LVSKTFWDAGCFLARLDVNDSIQLFSGYRNGGQWANKKRSISILLGLPP